MEDKLKKNDGVNQSETTKKEQIKIINKVRTNMKDCYSLVNKIKIVQKIVPHVP